MVRAAEKRVRRDGVVTVASAVGAVVAMALVMAWLAGGVRVWAAPSPAPLILELVALAVVGAVTFIGIGWILGVDERRVAAAAEARRGLPAGSLRGVLELGRELPAGASPMLFRRAEAEIAGELAGVSVLEMAGTVGEMARARSRRALLLFGLLASVAATLAFVSPERSKAAWSPLLNPVAHLTPPPLPPLVVEPGDAEVQRGADLEVRIHAPGRTQVILHARSAGDVPTERPLVVTGDRATATLSAIDAPLLYWVNTPDGATSDTFRVQPVDPLLVSDLVVDVVYPAYLERAVERFEGDVPPLEIPEGTELQIRGRTTRRLDDARLVHEEGAEVPLDVQADRFDGRWTPRASGRYAWALRGAEGEAAVATPAPLDITVVGDSAPGVEITFPGTDTLLGPDMRQPVHADAWDDHGLTRAVLVSWRVSALGEKEPPTEQPLELEGEPTSAAIRTLLDASQRRLLSGDTLYYYVQVTDNSPARQTTASETYKLWIPSLVELREQAQREAADLVADASRLTRSARRLGEETRDLSRRRSASASPNGQPGRSGTQAGGRQGEENAAQRTVEYRQAQEAQQLLDRQERMLEEVAELRERVEELQRAMEAAGLHDPELQQRLQELRQLYDQILTPELRQKLEDLRGALNQLDAEQMRQALEQLAQQQEQFQQQLEQSLELLRRAAAEQQMNALANQAQELARQQEALAEAMKREGAQSGQLSPEQAAQRSAQQQQLAEQAASLQQALQQLQQQLQQQGESQAAEQAGEAARQMQAAQQGMEQAAQQAGQRQGQQAGQSGEQAAQQAQQAAQTLQSARQAMTQAWKQEVQQTVQQATQDALSLAQRQNALAQRMQQAQQQGGQPSQAEMQAMRSEQAALQQGLQALGRNLAEASERSAMINREVGSALGRANLSMQQTLDALEGKDGARRLPAQEAAQSVEALNRLALALLANGQQIAQSQSGTGLQEALEQLAELARQQGSVNGQASSLVPLNLAPQLMGQQLQQLARQQREIAQKLGGMNDMLGGREDVLGRLDELAREAEQLARDLSGGRLDAELLARQERLFHRLLDAGRTLERDETTEERVAERPGNVPPSAGRPLDAKLVQASPRFPTPDAEQLRSLPPGYRRLILEYFDRLNRGRNEEPSEGRR
jgi:hypothetical protein